MLLVTEAMDASVTDAVMPSPAMASAKKQPKPKRLAGRQAARQLHSAENESERPVTPTSMVLSERSSNVAHAQMLLSQPSGGETQLKIGAYVAIISVSVAVLITLILGSYQFIETQKNQRALLAIQKESLYQEQNAKEAELNSKAVALFLKYNELMLQVNAPASKNAKKETRYWKENLAVNLLESLFNLSRGNKEWETTIGWALEKHWRFMRDQRPSCATYSSGFVRYMEKSFGANAAAFCKDFPNPD